MHTAYERSDNANPSPVSAVAISRDHRCIYVGDHRGRVFCWCVPQEPGRSMADHWIRDENAEVCTGCKIRFSLTERRHHCRNCGLVFCNKYDEFLGFLKLISPLIIIYIFHVLLIVFKFDALSYTCITCYGMAHLMNIEPVTIDRFTDRRFPELLYLISAR